MRRTLTGVIVAGITIGGAIPASLALGTVDTGRKPAECSRHGTAIDFYSSPNEAAAAAKKTEKLVFVLHVSGHFETPEFT